MANIDLSKYGITGTTEIVRNPSYEELFAEETKDTLTGYDVGTVTELGGGNWRFEADVFDAVELLPWIRTFTGRIVSLKSTNAEVEKRFYGDLAALRAMYGGDADAVQ